MASSVEASTGADMMDIDAAPPELRSEAGLAGETSTSQAVAAVLPASLPEIGPSLDRVPDDVLLQIWTQLDDPLSFSGTSRRFLAVSKDAFFRARWFLQHYPLHLVIFHAIARPKVFDAKLLEVLLNSGAPLSRHLVQLLYHLYDRTTASRQPMEKWGSGLSFRAYMAILSKAEQLYGDEMVFRTGEIDDVSCSAWLLVPNTPDGDLAPNVPAGITKYRYLPLPLSFKPSRYEIGLGGQVMSNCVGKTALENIDEETLLRAPKLAPLWIANGYRMSFERSLLMCRDIFAEARASTTGTAKSMAKLLELRAAGVLQLSRNVASNVIYDLRHPNPLFPQPPPARVIPGDYAMLMDLHRQDKLPFNLEDVVEELATYLVEGAVDPTLIPLAEQLDEDFPNVMNVSALFVQCMFVKAEEAKTSDLETISMMMGRHMVTAHDAKQACLRNRCETTMPLRYAARFTQNFDLEAAVKELIEALLNQPYRGRMLKSLTEQPCFERGELPAVTVDVASILAAAVERRAFSHRQIPSQEWHRFDADGERFVNTVPSLRSLLSFRWTRSYQGTGRNWSLHLKQLDYGTGSADVPGFGRWLAQGDEIQQEPKEVRANRICVPSLSPLLSPLESNHTPSANGADGLGTVELIRLRDALSKGQPYFMDGYTRRRYEHERRFQNIGGELPNEPSEVALAVFEALGPASKAADIILSHSLLNGNTALSDKLISSGVRLTLEHIKIALRIGWELPKSLYDHIKQGLPFKASFGAAENEADRAESAYSTSLPIEVREKCLELGASDNWPRTLHVDADETLRIELVDTRRGIRESTVVIRSNSEAKGSEEPILSTVEAPTSNASADVQLPTAELPAAGVDEGNEATSSTSGAAERITRSRSRASLAPGDKGKGKRRYNSYDPEEQCLVNEPDGLVSLISWQERSDRLKPLKLWLSHLAVLKRSEEVREEAVKLAFGVPEDPEHSSDAAPRRFDTYAQRGLSALYFNVERSVDALEEAVPVSEAGGMLAEVRELWRECDEAEDEQGAAKIRAFVKRRLQGKMLRQDDFRRTFHEALYQINKDTKLSLAWMSSLNLPNEDNDPFDYDFEPGLSDYSDEEDDEDDERQPARKRARFDSSAASKGKGKAKAQPAPVAPQAAPSSQQAVASGSGVGAGPAGPSSDSETDSEVEQPMHTVRNNLLFHKRAFEEYVQERGDEGVSQDEAAVEWEEHLDEIRDELGLVEEEEEEEDDYGGGCPCGVCHAMDMDEVEDYMSDMYEDDLPYGGFF